MNLGKLLEETCIGAGLEVLRQSATGGSATTIVDTSLASKYAENKFLNYIAIISETTDGLSPQGKFGLVSAYVQGTQTFTIPTVTDAVGAGDVYCIIKPVVKLYELIGRINRAVQALDPIRRKDTTLTGTASTLAYNIPVAIKGYSIQKVEIGNDTDGWITVNGYSVSPGAPGAVDQLIFPYQPPYDSTTAANQTIKIWYLGKNPKLSLYSDAVDERYPDDLVVSACVEKVLEFIGDRKASSWNDKNFVGHLNDVRQRAAIARMNTPVRNPPGEAKRKISLRDA